MQRPPNRSAPPVLFAHGTSEWIRRVNEKHKQLASLNLSSEQKGRLEKWSEIEFIHSTLALEGFDLVRERIAEAIYSEAQVGADYSETATLLISLRKVTALAGAKGKRAELTTDLLRDIHSVPGAEFRKTPAASDFRKTPGSTAGAVKLPAPQHLPALLESACQWYTADSFVELNPIEQAALVLLRLIEIQPFEEKNERTALVAASLFTLRSDLPPLIIKAAMNAQFLLALDEAARMNTKPMVELLALVVAETLDESIKQVPGVG